MTDTPGRLLSSLSNADGRPPKVGGCVGVFFQLFDWNRRLSGKHLFSTKSLPAERPKNKKFNDEKLPMAKLLLIADENRGGFPRSSSSECQSEVSSEKSSENGSSKRPGVVARLMGLESLPDTDTQMQQSKELKKQPHQQQQEHHNMYHYQELQMLEDLLQAQSEDLRKAPCNTRRDKLADFTKSSEEAIATRESLSKPFMREEKMPKNTKKNQERMDKFAKLPLSPKRSGLPFASILSPSKSNKVSPPIKSQSTSSNRRTALLLGAAVKILEPSMQPSGKTRPLLEKGSDSGVKGVHGNSFHSDLRKSLPKNNKQALKSNKDASEKQEMKRNSGSARTPTSLFQSKSSSKNGSTKGSTKQQLEGVKSQSKLDTVAKIEDQASVSEHEDDFQSLECDSQASSSKENRNAVKPQGVPPPVATTATFRRSGSVKEEQPPTPPSRGSLFRSKSVKEEATPTTPQLLQSQQGVEKCGGKEVRLKREKRQRSSLQEGSFDSGTQKSEPMRRKPALDQGRANSRGNQQEAQQKSKISVPPKHSRAPAQKQSGKSSLLSYDRLFGTRKQNKNSSKGESTNSEEQAKKTREEASMKSKEVQKKSSETSLMKSLLRRKPLNKAETVSSAKKKVAERPRTNKEQQFQAYERQTRSGGSSPARNFKEVGTVHAVEPEECDSGFASTEAKLCEQQAVHDRYGLEVLKERNQQPGGRDNLQHQTTSVKLNDPVVVRSPEKLQGGERMQQQVYFEADMLTDRSLEEILKTILSKSLTGRPSLGDSPLGKASREEAPMENVAIEGAEDATVVDMEISPAGTETTSPCDDQLSDLPTKVLFEEDEKQASTPFSPSKSFDSGMFALPLMDTGDPTKAVASAEDGGQPSPVSVLDFSALQSPFPSETATSGDDIDEDGKHHVLESVAESGAAASTNVISNNKTMDAILDSFSIKFPDLSEMGSEDAASCAGHEIECYIREVLTTSGLVTDDGLEPAGVPCSREIFERLEKQQRMQGLLECASDMQLCSKKFETPTTTLTGSCHRLMYDCIGEALNMTLAPFRDENLCSGWSSLRQRPRGEELMTEVAGHILSWREMTLGMVDDLVEVDMSTASGKWNEFSEESRELGLDLERMIFRSVFEDLIVDLVGLRSTTRNLRALHGSSFYC